MSEDIIKEKKRFYFLLMALGISFIIFLLTIVTVGKGEIKKNNELSPGSKKVGQVDKTNPIFKCGERISYQNYEYKTVKIGEQCWFAENLKVTKYRDGTPIPNLQDEKKWADDKTGAYVCYDNSTENCQNFGPLYNWWAIENKKGLCPNGWKVPTHLDWANLEMTVCQSLGHGNCDVPFGEAAPLGWRGKDEGKSLKAKSANGSDTFRFDALLAGFRSPGGSFALKGKGGFFWTSCDFAENFAYARMLDIEKDSIRRFSDNKKSGFSIRCVKE